MAETGNPREPVVSCDDIGFFQEVIKKMRIFDDKIIYALNQSIPTDSFNTKVNPTAECKRLFGELTKGHAEREELIKRCVSESRDEVESLREQRSKDRDNIDLMMVLKRKQGKLRLMQQELSVEEVVKDRTLKAFYERCRLHYIPSSLQKK